MTKMTASAAKSNYHAKGSKGTRARLAYTLMGLHGDGKSTDKHAGDKRTSASRLYQVG